MNVIFFNKKVSSNSLTQYIFRVGTTLLVALIISYIFQINEMTREDYLIRNYDREIKTINEESRSREYSFLQANSLSRVQEINFEKVDQVEYIGVSRPQVASK